MSKSYDQPVLNANNIIISDARIFLKTYASSYQFTGDAAIDLDNPPTGFLDAGLISQAALSITKDEVKLEVGLPKNTVKTAERSREVTVSFNFSELGAETVALITGADKYNVVRGGLVTTGSTTTVTQMAAARFAAALKASDKIVQIDAATGAIGNDQVAVSSISGAAVTHAAFLAAAQENDAIVVGGAVASMGTTTETNDTFVMDAAQDASAFAVGDFVVWAEPGGTAIATLTALRDKTERYRVIAKPSSTEVQVDRTVVGTPTASAMLVRYNSVELVDQLGSQIRRTLLMFFDFQDDQGNDFQYCLYFPKVKATGAFSPDFKGGENYADVPAGFSAEAVSLPMADGTNQRVLVVPYIFSV